MSLAKDDMKPFLRVKMGFGFGCDAYMSMANMV
jgi:hypothetical protein